ncbi:MAG: flagellar hook protein FlgK [Alphaproteobacteria bacterium]|nr:MAG: flagellar hook protein FlgK [Alphaproteobacteria bacterium]
MTLTSALRIATNSLSNTSRQVSTISQNISGVGNPDYVRREAQLSPGANGFQTVQVVRRVDQSLVEALGIASSKQSQQKVVVDYFSRLSAMMGGDDLQYSPSALLGALKDGVDLAAASPADPSALSALVERARDLATYLNSSYSQVLTLRREADQAVDGSVAKVNELLAQIKTVNDEIVQGSRTGATIFDALDKRDMLVAQLSEEIGISVRVRADNDIAIYTNSGLTLFDKVPRAVEFAPTTSYGPATAGNAVYVDGVPATGADAGLAISGGRLAGYIEARDSVLPQQQARLDELARGLIEVFAETDQTGGGKPPLAGLFTWSGGPALPASGTLEPGIALSIAVNAAVDLFQGGDPTLLRDGGISGDPDYVENTAGSASYTDRLLAFSDLMSQSRPFDAAAALTTDGGLDSFADMFVGAFEQARQDASDRLDYRTELKARLSDSLRLETGPNLDYEMSQLLEVERAYQASAKLIAAVDELIATLLAAV